MTLTCAGPVTDRSPWWRAAVRPGEDDGGAPDWAQLTERALGLAGGRHSFPPDEPADGVRTLEPVLAPFLAAAQELLDASAPTTVVPAAVAVVALREVLSPRLCAAAARTLVRELHRSRARGDLTAATAEGRFAEFVERAARPDRLVELVATYPVLGRILGQACVQQVRALTELVERLSVERATIVDRVLGGHDPGPVIAIRCGLGDRHGGGRTVSLVEFAGDVRVVYKPRFASMHTRYAELVGWLAEAAPGLDLRAARSAAQPGGHGWVEFVRPAPCASRAEAEHFHRRLGALLALLHAFATTDAHCENIIAAGDQPVLIDVETLFHPSLTATPAVADDPAWAALVGSVDRVCLLPRRMFGDHAAPDLSGMGGADGEALPDEVVTWIEAGTDRMRLVRRPRRFGGAANRPELHERPLDPAEFRDDLLDGFRAAYQVLLTDGGQLLRPGGVVARAAEEPTRVVVRDSATYSRLVDEGTHPDLLGNVSGPLGLFTAMPAPPADRVFPAEVDDLWAGDVPLFEGRASSRDLWSSCGTVIPAVLERSVLDGVRERLAGMAAADRERQEWVISAALALGRGPVTHRSPAAGPGPAAAPPDPTRLVAAACGIADLLAATAYRSRRRVNWIGMELVDDRFWAVLPLGAGLATGYPGVALFLAQLAAVTGVERYADLARRTVTGLPDTVRGFAADPEAASAVGCGAFHGLGGIAYATARLATLLDDDALASVVPDAVASTVAAAEAEARAGGETDGGLATGLAGAVTALRAVHAERDLPAAASGAAHLAGRCPPPPEAAPPGFLSGADGQRWALGWRRSSGGTAPGGATPDNPGWCSGTAGALLAAPRDAAAAATLAATAPRADHSLCHGELGILDVLTTLGSARSATARRTARLLATVERDGPRCGTPSAVPAPALLSGLAGIGYGLLRIAHPSVVPSVLLLQPTPPAPAPLQVSPTPTEDHHVQQ